MNLTHESRMVSGFTHGKNLVPKDKKRFSSPTSNAKRRQSMMDRAAWARKLTQIYIINLEHNMGAVASPLIKMLPRFSRRFAGK